MRETHFSKQRVPVFGYGEHSKKIKKGGFLIYTAKLKKHILKDR